MNKIVHDKWHDRYTWNDKAKPFEGNCIQLLYLKTEVYFENYVELKFPKYL